MVVFDQVVQSGDRGRTAETRVEGGGGRSAVVMVAGEEEGCWWWG